MTQARSTPTASAPTSPAPPRRRPLGTRKGFAFAVFLAPALLLLITTRVVPLLGAVTSSVGGAPGDPPFLAYQDMFASASFWSTVRLTLWFNLIINPVQILIALALAVFLTQHIRGEGLWRTLIFLPVAIPQTVSTIVWGIAFRPSDGLVNSVIATVGLAPQPWLTSSGQALYAIMIIASWVGVGYWMMFLIAGIRDLPASTLEAAAVDGAGWWRSFLYVKIPLLARPLAFVLVADTVANFLLFVPVQVLTSGGPGGSTNLLMFETYRQAFTFADLPYANAHVLVLASIMTVVVSIQFRLLQRLQ